MESTHIVELEPYIAVFQKLQSKTYFYARFCICSPVK